MLNNELILGELNRFYSLQREATIMYENWAKSYGLTFSSVMLLYSLYENKDTCTQKMASQKWLLPKQTVNAILKDFEKRKLICMSPLPSDKRNKIIHFTPAGEHFADEVILKLRDLEMYVVENMGVEQVKVMNNHYAHYNELFKKGDENQIAKS